MKYDNIRDTLCPPNKVDFQSFRTNGTLQRWVTRDPSGKLWLFEDRERHGAGVSLLGGVDQSAKMTKISESQLSEMLRQ